MIAAPQKTSILYIKVACNFLKTFSKIMFNEKSCFYEYLTWYATSPVSTNFPPVIELCWGDVSSSAIIEVEFIVQRIEDRLTSLPKKQSPYVMNSKNKIVFMVAAYDT